ncbi:hypothetical protein G3I59_28670 [Amycolatopsis rubida]|uniref:Uncharacterized protein n=1 Tax=Amycolatopsis rubida TaxID=112413 RepID=A0ABX0C010_9PSEU|nr:MULTISPECIES: hypothetical protein [Amycolatopsis]MYW94460.1 hypothetical protein [Amycolatopsis rubida]NEC59448.1 hypothetical protein [Amycolatopsis rubida]
MLEVLAQLVLPVVAAWDFVGVRNRRGKVIAMAGGPRGGQAFSVAERLTRYSGEIAVEVWLGQGKNCPQWSPSPACLYWERRSDGAVLGGLSRRGRPG